MNPLSKWDKTAIDGLYKPFKTREFSISKNMELQNQSLMKRKLFEAQAHRSIKEKEKSCVVVTKWVR